MAIDESGPTQRPDPELEIGVDWLTPGPFSESEKRRIVAWYSVYHGDGDLELAPFVPFWLEHGPNAFRGFKRFVESYPSLPGGLSLAALQVILMHNYACVGYAEGMLYELIGAKEAGAAKAEILEALEFAWVYSGPPGATPTAQSAGPYLARWTDDGASGPSSIWPDAWSFDSDLMDAGLDFTARGMTGSEIDSLFDWYREYYGEVPAVIRRLAHSSPESLKALRQRYEGAHRGALPTQAFPMMSLVRALYRRDVGRVRTAVHHARRLGVDHTHISALGTILLAYHGDSLDGDIAELVW